MIGHKYTPTVGHTGSYAFGDHVRRNLGATVVELGIPPPSGVGSVNKENPDPTPVKKAPKTTSKSVRCVETRKIFKSLREAGEFLGIHSSGIGHVLHGQKKTAGGYHWEFVMP